MSQVETVRDPDQLRTLYESILEPSFPPSELESLGTLTSRMLDGKVTIYAVESEEGRLAVAVTEPLSPSSAVLLSYFATRADQRGRGVGSDLYRNVLSSVREPGRPSMVLVEVERPDRHPGDGEHGDPTARLRFYGRHGARVLDLPYFQPAIADGGERVYGMLLLALWFHPAGLSADGARLTEASGIGPAVDSILGGESTVAKDDAAAVALRESARVGGGVRLLAVEDYAQVAVARGPEAGAR